MYPSPAHCSPPRTHHRTGLFRFILLSRIQTKHIPQDTLSCLFSIFCQKKKINPEQLKKDMCESEFDNTSVCSAGWDEGVYNQWCTRVIDVVPRFIKVLHEQNMVVPIAGYFENREEFWPMEASKAPQSLLEAEYVVVFAESLTEKKGDTVNTYRFKNAAGEFDHKSLRELPLKVHFISYAAFVHLWSGAPPLLSIGAQLVRCSSNRKYKVKGVAAIREEPRFDSRVVTHTRHSVTAGDSICRSAKKGKHEVYVYVQQPAEGWVALPELYDMRLTFSDMKPARA